MFKTYREEKKRNQEAEIGRRENLYRELTEREPTPKAARNLHRIIEKEYDLKNRLQWAAYDVITRAPSVKVTVCSEYDTRHYDYIFSRDIYPKGYKNAQHIRRLIQTILFIILLFGIYPWHYNRDYIMSRSLILLTCMAYTIITAWIHIEKTSAKLYEQNIKLLNKLITTDDIAAYMRTRECYQFISDLAESPYTSSKDRNRMSEYIFWYLHRPPSQPQTSVRQPQS